MRTAVFQWNNATFEVQEDTVSSNMDSDYILYRVHPEPTLRQRQHGVEYGTFLATVRIKDGNPGFALPSVDAPLDELLAFYDQWRRLPGDLRTQWNLARLRLMAAVNPDLAPGLEKKDNSTAPTGESATSNSKPSIEHSTATPEAASA